MLHFSIKITYDMSHPTCRTVCLEHCRVHKTIMYLRSGPYAHIINIYVYHNKMSIALSFKYLICNGNMSNLLSFGLFKLQVYQRVIEMFLICFKNMNLKFDSIDRGNNLYVFAKHSINLSPVSQKILRAIIIVNISGAKICFTKNHNLMITSIFEYL